MVWFAKTGFGMTRFGWVWQGFPMELRCGSARYGWAGQGMAGFCGAVMLGVAVLGEVWHGEVLLESPWCGLARNGRIGFGGVRFSNKTSVGCGSAVCGSLRCGSVFI